MQGNSTPLSEKSRSDALLRNRMILCAFSICLMWASSLRTATYISSFVIHVPQSQTFYDSCKSAIQIIIEEEKRFASCVDRQLGKCDQDLQTALSTETDRINGLSLYNTKVVNFVQQSAKNCSKHSNVFRKSLEEWHASSQSLPNRNGTCSLQDQEIMMSTVYDVNVLRSDAHDVSAQFSRDSRNTIQHIVDYARIRSAYDINYTEKYMDMVSDEVKKYLSLTKIPDLKVDVELDEIQRYVDNLLSCSTFSIYVCEFPYIDMGLTEMWYEYRYATRQNWIALEDYWYTVCNDFIQNSYDLTTKTFEAFVKFNEFRSNAVNWFNDPPCNGVCEFWVNEIKASLATGVPVFGAFGKAFPDEILEAYQNFINFDILMYGPIEFSLQESIENLELNANILNNKLNDIYADEIWPKIESAHGTIYGIKKKKFQEAKEIVLQFNLDFVEDIQHVKSNFKLIPADYTPPIYIGTQYNVNDLAQEKEQFDKSAESASAIDTIVNASKSNEQISNVTLSLPPSNVSVVKTKATNFDFTFEQLRAPGIDFDIWFLKFTSFGDLIFLVDFAFRFYFSIRMCYRYWQVNKINVPHIDIRSQKETMNPFQMTNGRIVIFFLTNPIVGAVIGFAILLITATTITSVYLPLYSEYRNGCVPLVTDGTFISKNFYSSAYNIAYRGGGSSIVKRSDDFEVRKSNACSSLYMESAGKQALDTENLSKHLQNMQAIEKQMNSFHKCIDIDIVDSMFQEACCGMIGYELCDNQQDIVVNLTCPVNYDVDSPRPFPPPGQFNALKSCGAGDNEIKLNDAIFDCKVLPECDTTCKAPNKERIRKVTKECSCLTEWFLHSSWLRCLLSFAIFALLNVSRIGFINGLAKVIWKCLHPGKFTVLATCDSNGDIIIKDSHGNGEGSQDIEIPSTSSRITRRIKKQIKWKMFIFRANGLVLMLGSFAINFIWAYLLLNSLDGTEPQWLR